MEVQRHAMAWVEIPVTDFARAKAFYSKIFDYEMPEMEMGPVRMGILLYDAANGGIGGAIVQGQGYVPSRQGPKVYLNANPDLLAVLGRVADAGGVVTTPKFEVGPGLGFVAGMLDSEGNEVYLHSQQ